MTALFISEKLACEQINTNGQKQSWTIRAPQVQKLKWRIQRTSIDAIAENTHTVSSNQPFESDLDRLGRIKSLY